MRNKEALSLLAMTYQHNQLDLAIQYHESLPKRIRQYLNNRGIPDEIIDSNILGWNGWRITIPIYNRQGEVVFFRLAKDPEDKRPAPKMHSSPGSSVELYGWDEVLKHPQQIIVCEGEFDRLVLQTQGFAAVTSTGGAATFRPQWTDALRSIKEVYLCFDRDHAGKTGAKIVALMIPEAKVIELPEEVGQGGDVTDFFVRLKRSREDFLRLLEAAKPTPQTHQAPSPHTRKPMQNTESLFAQRTERIKREMPIEKVIAEYVKLKASGAHTLVGRCPFHDDRIPSFTVYLQSDTYHCFGCRAHGDVISFVRAMENLSFAQALVVLDHSISYDESKSKDNSSKRKAA
jgi:DNA primase